MIRFCAHCGAKLSDGAQYCHRCGTAVGGHPAAPVPTQRTPAALAPWGIAAVALVVVVAVMAVRKPQAVAPAVAPNQTGPAPNIANMTPSERANRLYVRVMSYAEAGLVDSVATFAPMVIAAHEMLDAPNVDERYHFGRVAEVVGALPLAEAQADTILSQQPQSLLGLLLAVRVARMRNDTAAAKQFEQRLLAALPAELALNNPDYESHRLEIDLAVADARRP